MVSGRKATILIADDEPLNLEIISEHLEPLDYDLVAVDNGDEAWERLEREPHRFDVVLLDRMMPGLDGMEVLERIKRHPVLKALPVVMQTASASQQDMLDGLKAGAYYYLTKPFEEEMLQSIVATAAADRAEYRRLQDQIDLNARILGMMEEGRFSFRTLKEGRALATLLANVCPEPMQAVIGMSELLINAVEHGNLGIGYEEKSELMARQAWASEVERRLALPENADKFVEVLLEKCDRSIRVTICDQGKGFDWSGYIDIAPERAFDSHGRGIAMSRLVSFDELEYQGAGNRVTATIYLSPR